MNRRQQGIQRLSESAVEGDKTSCIQEFFEIIYGLPGKVVLELSKKVMQSHVDFFLQYCSEGEWVKELLNNLDEYCNVNGRERPCVSEKIGLDCQEYFDSAVDGLLLAHAQQEYKSILAAACTYTVFSTINAVQANKWKKKHFVSYKKFEDGESLSKDESIIALKIYKEIAQKEWCRVRELLNEYNVSGYVDNENIGNMRSFFNKWMEDELVLPG